MSEKRWRAFVSSKGQIPKPQGYSPWDAGRLRRHLGLIASHRTKRARMVQHRQVSRRHLYRSHRTRKCRNGERDLQYKGVRLRYAVLVAPPQSKDRCQQPAGEVALNLGVSEASLHLWRCLRCRKCWDHSRGPDAPPGRECDLAIAGGVSESIHTFGIFASFKSQGALAEHSTQPKPLAPSTAIGMGSLSPRVHACMCWNDSRMPKPRGQTSWQNRVLCDQHRCDRLRFAEPGTAGRVRPLGPPSRRPDTPGNRHRQHPRHRTTSGDSQECQALRTVFDGLRSNLLQQHEKLHRFHAMGAAGALELAGNLPSFQDRVCHATINLDALDPDCALPGLVANEPRELPQVNYLLNNSFGM